MIPWLVNQHDQTVTTGGGCRRRGAGLVTRWRPGLRVSPARAEPGGGPPRLSLMLAERSNHLQIPLSQCGAAHCTGRPPPTLDDPSPGPQPRRRLAFKPDSDFRGRGGSHGQLERQCQCADGFDSEQPPARAGRLAGGQSCSVRGKQHMSGGMSRRGPGPGPRQGPADGPGPGRPALRATGNQTEQ
jgi:hypothetical protein